MSRKDKKFGSPFDPMFPGSPFEKQRLPEKREPERREEDRYGLRGCGDPDCFMCNNEVAAIRERNGQTGRPFRGREGGMSTSSYGGGPPRNASDALREEARRMMEEYSRRADEYGYAPPPQAGPPESYRKARKECEDWIVEAPEQDFDDIVGNEEALETLKDAIQAPVKYKELYEAYGMKMPKGALLSGPPGCGKTMFARAAAAEMKRLYGKGNEFLLINGSSLQGMFIGVTEGYIESIFTYAREYKKYHGHPLLIFIDEAEVLFPDRTGRVRRVAPWEESQVATFLAQMDGVQESGAFILLATNRPEVMDQALLRDGRCDFKIVVQRPTQKAVEVILQKNFNGILLGTNTIDELIFAALESLYDPHKVIVDARAIGLNIEERKIEELKVKHFTLSHIISGAMAASIPQRAKRHAFARDKLTGVAKGVLVEDVLKAVNDLFKENKDLDHSYALEEFKREFETEFMAEQEAKGVTKQ